MPTTNAERRLTLEERVVVLEKQVDGLQHRLYGNGQPGDVEKLEKRVGSLEQWFWKTLGASTVIAWAANKFVWSK